MWPILLKILSIIGIVIGGILGVVILLLLLILLSPIVYKLDGSAHEGKYEGAVKLKYLFGIVRGGFIYPKPGGLYLKVLWFNLIKDKSAKKENAKKRGKNNKDNDAIENNMSNDSSNDKNASSTEEAFLSGATPETKSEAAGSEASTSEIATSEGATSEIATSEASETDASETNSTSASAYEAANEAEATEEASHKKIFNPFYYVRRAFINFKYKAWNKVKLIYYDISYYIRLIDHEDTRGLISSVKKKLIKILKIIAPKKGKVDIIYGLGSPDLTAKIYGIYCVLFLKWPKTFKVVPDLENKIIEGEINVKGYFNLFSIVIQAIPIVLGRKLRITRKRIAAHKEKKEALKLKNENNLEKNLNELEADYS